MLDKRTSILFDTEEWNQLKLVAEQSGHSVGDLVRTAVRKMYLNATRDQQIVQACQQIKAARKIGKRINYKALIEHGKHI